MRNDSRDVLRNQFGLDAADLDMVARGDLLGSALGAKVFVALTELSRRPTLSDEAVEKAIDAPFPVAGYPRTRVHDYINADPKALMRAALTAAFSPPEPAPSSPVPVEPMATHRHVKRGTEYVLIGYGTMQAEGWAVRPGPGIFLSLYPVDMREVAIYRAVDDGSLWVRPREEFEDGRFVALPAAHSHMEKVE